MQTPPQRPRQATALVASSDSAQYEVVSAEVKFTPLPQPHGLPGWERFHPGQATVQLALGTTARASMSVWLACA